MDRYPQTCEICQKNYVEATGYEAFSDHYQTVHPTLPCAPTLPSLYWVPITIPPTSAAGTQTPHVDLSSQNRTCPECGQTFVSNKGMKQHIAKVHVEAPKNESCPECGKEFKHKYAVKFHIKQVHRKSTRVQCPYCGKEAYNKYMLVKHLKNQHLKEESPTPPEKEG
mmetsp:Transcript_25633/g.44856  ORF Transcript_25633/g.44856 Transcript_25633/m.44856 type:complete len:167 (+) Transcript_25633:23-523(+)